LSSGILNENLTILTNSTTEASHFKSWLTTNGLSSKWTFSQDLSKLDSGEFDLYLYKNPNETNTIQKAFNRPLAKLKKVV